MPRVTKQTATTNGPAVRKSVLERIAPIGQSTTGIKLNVYGRGKTGKTRLACTFPKPLLLIGTEDGTKSVSKTKDGDYVRIYHSSELEPLVGLVVSGNYSTVVLDTGGGIQDMILKEVLGLDDIPVQKSWGMSDRATWGIVGAQCKERFRSILNLADRYGTDVVIIAHERNFGEESSNDVAIPTVGSALTPSVAGWLNAECDYIVQTFVRQKEVSESMTVGVGKSAVTTTVRKKVKGVEYCLRVGADPVYMTGFRVPDGIVLPDVIVDPHYDKIVSLIRGEVPAK